MLPNEMLIELTALEEADVKMHLDAIITIYNNKKIVQLSDKERQTTPSVSAERYPYVRDTYEAHAVNYPNLLPPFKVFANELRNYHYMNQNRTISSKLDEVNDIIGDHSIAAEYFCYKYMRQVYDIAKQGVDDNVPGADVVVNSIGPLFDQEAKNEPLPT